MTGDAVDYEKFQDAAVRFPEIPRENFDRAVQLIEPDGEVSSGAAAVFRTLNHSRRGSVLFWAHENVPGFAPVSDAVYNFIARRRMLASAGTRLLWGDDVRRPTYTAARDWFLRAVGLVYLIAFVSLWVQIDGLIGRDGILPISGFLSGARAQLGAQATMALPTLCWWNSSDAFLHFLCGSGTVLSILLILGVVPIATLLLLFVCYLSLTIAGQTFLSFQWDILLLETGFLAILIAPVRLMVWPGSANPAANRVGVFLLKLLLFKLMLMSGVVKLTSGDDCWWKLTALDYHYWTQPLPTAFAWFADQSPDWIKKFSVAFCLVVEIVVPFFIWAPRRLRIAAAALMILLQVFIAVTGNYCFFNLLTAALCLLLIDDVYFHRSVAAAAGGGRSMQAGVADPGYSLQRYAAIGVLVVTLPINAMLIYSAFRPMAEWPRAIETAYSYIERFRIVNGYGLFRVMTKSRPEIVVEGSSDGVDWKPYRFRWKPGDLDRAPRWVAPHQPRLDWQMWFAALSTYRQNPWFIGFAERLLTNSRAVVALLATNPFPDQPPRYVRATTYQYQFTTAEERRRTGNWWKRSEPQRYLPMISLDDFQR